MSAPIEEGFAQACGPRNIPENGVDAERLPKGVGAAPQEDVTDALAPREVALYRDVGWPGPPGAV